MSTSLDNFLSIEPVQYLILSILDEKDISSLMRTSSTNFEIGARKLYRNITLNRFESIRTICDSPHRLSIYRNAVKKVFVWGTPRTDNVQEASIHFEDFPNATELSIESSVITREHDICGKAIYGYQYLATDRVDISKSHQAGFEMDLETMCDSVPMEWKKHAETALRIVDTSSGHLNSTRGQYGEDVKEKILERFRYLNSQGDIRECNFDLKISSTFIDSVFKEASLKGDRLPKILEFNRVDQGIFKILSQKPKDFQQIMIGKHSRPPTSEITLSSLTENLPLISTMSSLNSLDVICVRGPEVKLRVLDTATFSGFYPGKNISTIRCNQLIFNLSITYTPDQIVSAQQILSEMEVFKKLAHTLWFYFNDQKYHIHISPNNSIGILSTLEQSLLSCFRQEIQQLRSNRG